MPEITCGGVLIIRGLRIVVRRSNADDTARQQVAGQLDVHPHARSYPAHTITAIDARPPPGNEASLCQGTISKTVPGARGRASGVAGGGVVGLVVGSGSDLSEEPAVQDVEPVTLDFVSFLIVLPGPPITARVGERQRPSCCR